MKVLIATKNPGKIQGAIDALTQYYPYIEVEGISVPSNVPDQPVNDDTYLGAKNRVDNLIEYSKTNNIDAEFYIAIESGICEIYGNWQIINFAVIKDKNGNESVGTSAGFPVPKKYVEDIKRDSLGCVIDKILQTSNIRNSIGGISYLTHNKITRIDLTREAFTMALTKFINDDLWKD